MDTLPLDIILSILNLLIIPLFVWIWKTDRKTLVLETEFKTSSLHFSQLLEKLDEIKDELHNSFVSQRSCDFRHNSINKG